MMLIKVNSSAYEHHPRTTPSRTWTQTKSLATQDSYHRSQRPWWRSQLVQKLALGTSMLLAVLNMQTTPTTRLLPLTRDLCLSTLQRYLELIVHLLSRRLTGCDRLTMLEQPAPRVWTGSRLLRRVSTTPTVNGVSTLWLPEEDGGALTCHPASLPVNTWCVLKSSLSTPHTPQAKPNSTCRKLLLAFTNSYFSDHSRCANIEITGSGTKTGSSTVKFPGAYSASDP